MSTINVNNLSGKGGATPNLPDGAVISGVATVTNLKPTNVNVSGAVTATTFDGSLKSTGTPTLGLGVTINSSGVNVSGVLTATTLYGDGSNLTGVGETTAPWHYNPDVNDSGVTRDTGIGITFNKKISSGSGTATLKIVNAGAAGTTVQSWGVSSCTFNVTEFSLGALVSELTLNQTYQVDIPSGFIVDSNETSYAGTAYTFAATGPVNKLWVWGYNGYGELGDGTVQTKSSPVQIPGTNWGSLAEGSVHTSYNMGGVTLQGELWIWGRNNQGQLGQNNITERSSPVQVPGTTWKRASSGASNFMASKTDGTLWAWGYNVDGQCGHSNRTTYSSPVQIPGTNWTGTKDTFFMGAGWSGAIKTDGTLWVWGDNEHGNLAQNNETNYSSPTQIPGTNWAKFSLGKDIAAAVKTDGTLWTWGGNQVGELGINDKTQRSSPVQVPGTSWSTTACSTYGVIAKRTDGTLWSWGWNDSGRVGDNTTTARSSPIQIPGSTWNELSGASDWKMTTKTDGTLWMWGANDNGGLGQNSPEASKRSSPVQVGSETDWTEDIAGMRRSNYAIQADTTP